MITDAYVLWIGRFATLEVVLNDDIHGTGPAQPYLAGISRLHRITAFISLLCVYTLFTSWKWSSGFLELLG